MQLWERIFEHDRYGAQHFKRFQGDLSFDGGDHSLGVLRLVNTLARWTGGDPAKMRAMMLLSPLANDKWFSKRGKQDWLDYQIANAISYVQGKK
jgi:primase-polymerase (primpol)-like protein